MSTTFDQLQPANQQQSILYLHIFKVEKEIYYLMLSVFINRVN